MFPRKLKVESTLFELISFINVLILVVHEFLVYQIIIIMFHCLDFFLTIWYVFTNYRFNTKMACRVTVSYRAYSKCLPQISGSFINCGFFSVTDIKPEDRTKLC